MSDIRKIIQIHNFDSSMIPANIDCDAFWNGLVQGTDLAQKSNKKVSLLIRSALIWGPSLTTIHFPFNHIQCSPEAFVANEHAIDALVPAFDKSSFFAPGLGSTSIGKLSDFGLFNSFRPSVAGPDPKSSFVLNRLAMAMRATGADCKHIMNLMWEYDGEITIHMLASPRWHGDKAWKLYGKFMREYLKQILKSSFPKLWLF